MPFEEFQKECSIELDFLEEIVQAILSLLSENQDDTAPLKDRAAAASFVFSFYNGIENILKRTSKYSIIPLPKGEQWHSELATRFSKPLESGFPTLPNLISDDIATEILKLRKLRHVIAHGYAMNLDWSLMKPLIEEIPRVFGRFRYNLKQFLEVEKLNE
jgi:hypothetical protein